MYFHTNIIYGSRENGYGYLSWTLLEHLLSWRFVFQDSQGVKHPNCSLIRGFFSDINFLLQGLNNKLVILSYIFGNV